ncbi:MAG: hypothetical protein LBT08_00300 [Synergistaceae bacterium]|nr:hypothetical protein [Synergistaceae bacterium]
MTVMFSLACFSRTKLYAEDVITVKRDREQCPSHFPIWRDYYHLHKEKINAEQAKRAEEKKNLYNLVSFQGAAYTDNAALRITPAPDSALRVFMAFKPLSRPIAVPPQELVPFERKGFTVIEWGGSEVRF